MTKVAGLPKVNNILSRLMSFYENFSVEHLNELDDFYTQDIEFTDPVHQVNGILSLKHYLKKMAANLTHYRIRYIDVMADDNKAYLTWEMEFAHKSIRGGQVITVRGMTRLEYTSRIYYHEDCYDMGALLYEHLPVIGGITRSLKGRIAGQAH